MDCDLWVRNANIPDGDRLVLSNLLIKGGTFAGITDPGIQVEAREVLDLDGAMALPGCIDSHVHFMDPGFTHRETFASGTAAAAAGGLTTVVDMPCCSVPSVRDCASLENKLAAISPEAHVDFGLWGGATGEDVREGRLGHIRAQAEAGVIGFKAYMTPSVPSYPRSDDAELLEIFLEVAKTGLPVGVHAENYSLCDFNVRKLQRQGRTDGPAWAEARLAVAEKVAIEMVINFAEHAGARAHIVHMSTGAGALAIEAAKRRGLPVTAETCPHYLLLNARESMAEWGSFAKIAPPLRTPEDNAVLWEKLASGVVDFIATDHAPYAVDTEKAAPGMGIWDSFPGIPGVETMVPLLVSEGFNKGRLSLSRLVEVLSGRAARQYGLFPRKGSLSVGADADLTVIDPECEWTINKDAMVGKSRYSPFHGFRLKGKVTKTIVRGRVVYDDGQLLSRPGYGQFIKRQAW